MKKQEYFLFSVPLRLVCHLRPKLQTDSPDGGARLGARGHVPASKRLRTNPGGDAPHQSLSPVFHPSARNPPPQTSAGAITRKTPNPRRTIKYRRIASPVHPFYNNKMYTVFTLRRSGRPVSLHRATCHGRLDKLLKSPHRASSICRILLGFRKSRPYYMTVWPGACRFGHEGPGLRSLRYSAGAANAHHGA